MKCPDCKSEGIMPFWDDDEGMPTLEVICGDCGYIWKPKKEADGWVTWNDEGVGW